LPGRSTKREKKKRPGFTRTAKKRDSKRRRRIKGKRDLAKKLSPNDGIWRRISTKICCSPSVFE